jgi:hypothetical protein
MELINTIEAVDENGNIWVTECYGIDGVIYSTNTFKKQIEEDN